MGGGGGFLGEFFFGDDVQLPPALDCPVHKKTSKSLAEMEVM
jgi:hypothetical protein